MHPLSNYRVTIHVRPTLVLSGPGAGLPPQLWVLSLSPDHLNQVYLQCYSNPINQEFCCLFAYASHQLRFQRVNILWLQFWPKLGHSLVADNGEWHKWLVATKREKKELGEVRKIQEKKERKIKEEGHPRDKEESGKENEEK